MAFMILILGCRGQTLVDRNLVGAIGFMGHGVDAETGVFAMYQAVDGRKSYERGLERMDCFWVECR